MINFSNKEENCTGCGACVDMCHKGAVELQPIGKFGTVIAIINPKLCVDCNMCEKVCPKLQTLYVPDFEKKAFATVSKDTEILKRSSSGGVFSVLAEYFVNQGYTIYGAGFNPSMQLVTYGVNSIGEIENLCKSKYVQSNMQGIYAEIYCKLSNGEKVMFTGTPCQCKALALFSKEYRNNLFLVDFFCHGVPSQLFFDKCKELYEARNKCHVIGYEFRTKIKNGKTPHYYTITFKVDGKVKNRRNYYFLSPYYAAFQSYMNLRESCYSCEFAGETRYSDITIGDFHGIARYNKHINRFDGVSMVILNTQKGEKAFDNCSDEFECWNFNLNTLISDKQCFTGGTQKPATRDQFEADYNNMHFSELMNKWFKRSKYIKQLVYYSLPDSIRKIAKKVGGIE